MNKKEIEFRDPVVERVVNKFVSRSDVGFAKYGVTLQDDPSKMFEWLNHLQEELMDAVLYLQKAKETYTDELQDKIIEDMDPVDISNYIKLSQNDIEVIAEEIKSPGNPTKALVDATEKYKEILK
tara:strand:+ start:593 stop:967 length:375 start_codon:yes stop_codon:yes gene_type:complete